MSDFNPDQYRKSLKEKLGIANLTKTLNKKDFVDTDSALSRTNEEVVAPVVPVNALENENVIAPNVDDIGAESETTEDMAPAQSLLDTVSQFADEQYRESNDKQTKMMWHALISYFHKNRDKINKVMMDGAK